MRLRTLAVLSCLASFATADYMIARTECFARCDSRASTWYTAYGSYWIDANEGCRDPPDVPAMNQICMDWGNQRGHFYFDGQSRRCIRKTSEWAEGTRAVSRWDEVACTW
ncbi:hypothetical protein N657DRAFT_644809 [Parathielavia appendiculata]|uniref:Secreted protein n=1 Tax=Parathielavia appendiculata TaxID=2587402 RepID=A0AAN6U256_9PEZI|nr:hypothetical protein N657DRAFT_644809 [Parathielavia appendiculata]